MENRKFITYVVLDPSKNGGKFVYGKYEFDFEPIYVGSGSIDRPKYHWNSVNSVKFFKRPIYIKLKELKTLGYNFKYEVIEKFFNKKDSLIFEKKLISIIGTRPKGPLLNVNSGYSILGPFIAIDPNGICHYINSGELNKFSKEHGINGKVLLRSANRFRNTNELRKGYFKTSGYKWACIYVEEMGNTDVHSFTKNFLEKNGINFNDFVKSDPIFGFQESRILKAALIGVKKSSNTNLPLTNEQKKHLSNFIKNRSANKYGFNGVDDVKDKFNKLHHQDLLSTREIAKMFNCSQGYVASNIDEVMSEKERRAKKYGFDSLNDAINLICKAYYFNKMTYASISRKFNCTVEFVKNKLNECAVETIESL